MLKLKSLTADAFISICGLSKNFLQDIKSVAR